MQGDLFWRWNPLPGNLFAVRSHGPFTMVDRGVGDGYAIWYGDKLHARGGAPMIDKIWKDLTT